MPGCSVIETWKKMMCFFSDMRCCRNQLLILKLRSDRFRQRDNIAFQCNLLEISPPPCLQHAA